MSSSNEVYALIGDRLKPCAEIFFPRHLKHSVCNTSPIFPISDSLAFRAHSIEGHEALGNTAKMATTSNMFLYSLTIQPPTIMTQAVVGQFSGTREQLIATISGSRLVLLRPDSTLGKVLTLLSHDVFGIVRSLATFRIAGSNKGMSHPLPTYSNFHLPTYMAQAYFHNVVHVAVTAHQSSLLFSISKC